MASLLPATVLDDCRGVTTIEIALITPLMTLVLVGLLDMGMYVHREMDLTNAARVGAQYAFQDASDVTTIAATAINALGPLPANTATPSATASLTCECPTSTTDYTLTTTVACTTTICSVTSTKPATYVTVTIQQSYTPILGNWGILSARTMNATATLRVN